MTADLDAALAQSVILTEYETATGEHYVGIPQPLYDALRDRIRELEGQLADANAAVAQMDAIRAEL